MDILFLGYSNLVKRRILPVLDRCLTGQVHIAKFEGQTWDDDWQTCPLSVVRHDNYDEALATFGGGLFLWLIVSFVLNNSKKAVKE